MSESDSTFDGAQQQAIAALIAHRNDLRIAALLEALRAQDDDLGAALATIESALRKIEFEVVATNRGGTKGMHGFIAEVAEVGVTNARAQVIGERAAMQWVNDNGPVDLVRDGVAIQQKFVAAGGRFGLGAVLEHLERYPDFVRDGGRYQLPADHFAAIERLHAMTPDEAGRLASGGSDGLTFRDWERVRVFFEGNDVGIEALEPSALRYGDVQRGVYDETLATEQESLRATDRSRRDDAVRTSRPTVRGGASATAAAAAVESATAFVTAVAAKRRAGVRFRDFSDDDWADVLGASGTGLVTGAIRGASIYALTNGTTTPASVANAMVTSAIGVAGLANALRRGDVSEVEFIEQSELLCLQSAVGALAAVVGQAVIPLPVVGAVIGNTIGAVMYQVVSASLARREQVLTEAYQDAQAALDTRLTADHATLVERLRASTGAFLSVVEHCSSPDVTVAMEGSIALAGQLGVGSDAILDTEDKTAAYFLD